MEKSTLARQIGSNIAYWRKKRGLTQDQLSEQLGVSKQFLAHVERGERIFSIPTLYSAIIVLQVSADALLLSNDLTDIRKSNILRILSEATPDELIAIDHILAFCTQLKDSADN